MNFARISNWLADIPWEKTRTSAFEMLMIPVVAAKWIRQQDLTWRWTSMLRLIHSKTIKSKYGAVRIEVPLDRASTFEPILVPKRSRIGYSGISYSFSFVPEKTFQFSIYLMV